MKRIIAILALLVLSVCVESHAQSILINTTLSAALVNGGSGQVATVASATGITAPSAANPQLATYLVIDAELAQVVAVNGTQITLARGVGGTQSRTHASGAVVLVVPAYLATYFNVPGPTGSCTRTSVLALPLVSVSAGAAWLSDCIGGQWVTGDAGQTTRAVQWRIRQPETGAQTSGAVFGNNTTSVLDSIYCTEIDMSYSKLVTGLGIHVGTTGNSSDKWVLGLYDSSGALLAQSAAAGTAPGSSYAWSAFAFTAKYYVVGPGQYFGCMVPIASTTATVDTIKTAQGDNILTYTATSSTAALPASFTAPTSFTNAAGPYLYVY